MAEEVRLDTPLARLFWATFTLDVQHGHHQHSCTLGDKLNIQTKRANCPARGQLTLAAFTRGIILITFGPSIVAQCLTSTANGSLF
jgi:hypothetical protein